MNASSQRTLTCFLSGSITVWLTLCLTGLDSATLLMFNQQQIYLFGQSHISQIAAPVHRDQSIHIERACYNTGTKKINLLLLIVGLSSAEQGKLFLKIEIFLPISKMT